MVIHVWRQAGVLSVVALGCDCQCNFSICELQRSNIIRCCMRRGHRRISCLHLPRQRSLDDRGLYLCFIRVSALSRFCGIPEYLSRCFAKCFYHAIFCNILRRMLEKNEVPLFTAGNYGPLGQSAWRFCAWSFYWWGFFLVWHYLDGIGPILKSMVSWAPVALPRHLSIL